MIMMCVDVLDLDHDRVAAQAAIARHRPPVVGIMIGDDHHAIAER
jgi:hypothetical protein